MMKPIAVSQLSDNFFETISKEWMLVTAGNKDAFNTFDFGLGLGAGYWITPKLGINARYNAGFTDIYKENNGDSVKNNNFQVGLAYKFN